MKILITIPTLGSRPESLQMAVWSIRTFLPEAQIEIRTPYTAKLVESEIQIKNNNIRFVSDAGDQRAAILNSWGESNFDWYAWLNDDDFALAGVNNVLSKMEIWKNMYLPVVIYGDFSEMNEKTIKRIHTPVQVNRWMLSSGSNYVPGLLTFLNRPAVETLTRMSNGAIQYKNSFDYHWWLQLASTDSKFIHTGSCHAVWRMHAEARTQLESKASENETLHLKRLYRNRIQNFPLFRHLNTFSAKSIAKILARLPRV